MRCNQVEKPLVWLHGEVRSPPFSRRARLVAGELLGRFQLGQQVQFPLARPMPSIGSGCHELRVKDETIDWRIVLCVMSDAIVILEVFAKKTPRTPHDVISNCKRRLAAYRQAIR